jgi:hypothetical protein
MRVIASLLASAIGCVAHAGSPLVAELFTSQGCNSCPPAEEWLGELAQERQVIALAFHVQYWDDLGWVDRFGIPEAAGRQTGYVRSLQLISGFTPQLVLDARRSLLGSDRLQTRLAISVMQAAAEHGANPVVTQRDGQLHIVVPTGPSSANAEVLLLPLLSQARTAIGRGENGGRTLHEFNIVRAVRRLGLWKGAPAQFNVALASLPKEADRVAVLVQDLHQGAIHGASLTMLR